MNFVSQCIWAGFGGSNSPEDIKNCHSMDTEGTSAHKWYAVNVNNYSSSWAGTKSFKSYVDNPVAGEQDMNCLTKEIASTSNNLYFASSSLAGSAVLVRGFDANNNPAPLGHVVFINDAKGNTRDKLYMTSYNTNWKNKVFESRYPMLSYASDLDKLYVVVPVSMKNANPGFRLWGSLCNAMPSGASVPISGYASETCTTIAADIYNPAGNLVATRSENNCASIYFNYNFSQGGTWKVVLKGVDSSGHIAQFTYVIRIY